MVGIGVGSTDKLILVRGALEGLAWGRELLLAYIRRRAFLDGFLHLGEPVGLLCFGRYAASADM